MSTTPVAFPRHHTHLSEDATSQGSYPLIGDTTSNQALLFSPSFDHQVVQQSSFPNYTFASANLSLPSPPSSPVNHTLILAQTSSSPFKGLPRTTCALRTQQKTRGVTTLSSTQSVGLWLRDVDGWRWEWFVGGLTPNTNYTAYTLEDGQLAASRPINFVTKSGTSTHLSPEPNAQLYSQPHLNVLYSTSFHSVRPYPTRSPFPHHPLPPRSTLQTRSLPRCPTPSSPTSPTLPSRSALSPAAATTTARS